METLISSFLLNYLLSSGEIKQSSLPACRGQESTWTNCFKSQTYSNGDKYSGEFKDGKLSGNGTYTFASGNKYVGEFKDGKLSGQGKFTFAKGDIYVGDFKDSSFNGKGTFTFTNGNKYIGDFKDWKLNGQGTFNFANGDVYVGDFKDGLFDGHGTRTYTNGNKYTGDFKDGKFTGQGNFNFANGSTYVGEYKDDKFNGHGTLNFANGDRYIGQFKDDSFNGQGTRIYNNGDKYVGEYKDGKYNGQGTFTYTTGKVYVGEFKENFFSGQGTLSFANGDKYVGEFQFGSFNGQGTFSYNNGSKYVGEFKDDKRNGQGKLYEANGVISQVGVWRNDTLVPATPTVVTPVRPSGPSSTGSAFRIARGTFITNFHVIEGCSRLLVNGQLAQVFQSDKQTDLAQLRAQTDGPIAKLRGQRTGIGESVAVTGFPLRGLLSGFNMTTGTISSLSGLGGNTQYFQTTAPVQPGNSGGPMLDSAGNVVGVVVSKLDALKMLKVTGDIPQNVNFAINTNSLRSFLDAGALDYSVAGNDPVIPLTTIAERARGFTVLVECYQ